MKNRSEKKLGSTLKVDGVILKVVEGDCGTCFFKNRDCPNLECSSISRSDKKEICYEEKEKS